MLAVYFLKTINQTDGVWPSSCSEEIEYIQDGTAEDWIILDKQTLEGKVALHYPHHEFNSKVLELDVVLPRCLETAGYQHKDCGWIAGGEESESFKHLVSGICERAIT